MMNQEIEHDEVAKLLKDAYEAAAPEPPADFVDGLRTRLQCEMEAPPDSTMTLVLCNLGRRRIALGAAAAIVLGVGMVLAIHAIRQTKESGRPVMGPLAAASAVSTHPSGDAMSVTEDLDVGAPALPATQVTTDDAALTRSLLVPAAPRRRLVSTAPAETATSAMHGVEHPRSPIPAILEAPRVEMDRMDRVVATTSLVGAAKRFLAPATAPTAVASAASTNTHMYGYASNDYARAGSAADLLDTIKVDGMDAESLARLAQNQINRVSASALPPGRIWKGRQDSVLDGRLDGKTETFLVRFDVANGQFRAFLGKEGESPRERPTRIYHGQITTGQKPIMVWRRDDVDGYAAVNTLSLIRPGQFRGTWFDNSGSSGDVELELQDASHPGAGHAACPDRMGSAAPKPGGLPGVVFVSDLPWMLANAGAGNPVRRDVNINGQPIAIAGRVYPKGVWTHSYPDETPADVVIDVSNRGFAAFLADAGVEQSSDSGTVQFQVLVDGQKRAESPVMHAGAAHPFLVDVAGAKLITLRVLNGGDGYDSDHAAWGLARFVETATSRPAETRDKPSHP